MSLLTPEVLDILQQNSGNIRNICVLAHVDHGKTTLTDHLLTTNGIISSSLAGKVRMMDSRADEQEREITMKSSSIALAYRPALPAPWQLPLDDASVACDDDIAAGPCAAAEVAVAEQTKALAAAAARRPGRPGAPAAAATAAAAAAARAPVPAPAPAPAAAGPRRPHYLINVIDSPGHVDFSSEVASAVRLSDGAVVLVDVVEGLSVQTQAVLQQAWAEGVRPCLVLNKVDRLVGELKLTENEALEHCRRVIEQVNAVASTFLTAEAMDGAAADAVAAAAAASSSSEPAAPEPEPTEPEPEAEDGKKAHKKDRKSKHGSSAHDSAADAGNDKYAVALDETRQWVFDPARGNVAFVSAWDSWGFTVQQFAQRYRGLLELPSVRAIPAIKEVAAAAVAAAAAEAGSESAWDGDWESLPDSAATAAVSALLWGPYGWDSHAGAVVDTSPAAVAAAEAAAEASAGKEKKEKKEKKSDKSEKKDKKEKKSDKSDKKSKKSSAPSDSSSSGVASAESHAAADSTPLFVALVLRPIWALYAAAAEQSMEDVQAIVDAYGIAVTASGIGPTVRNFKTKIQNCFARWLPINEAVLGMSVSMLPSPKSAQKDRMQRLMPKLFSELPASDTDPSAASEPAAVKEGPVTERAHGVWTCDRTCPHSLVSVVKVIDLHSLGPGALGTFATAPAAVGSVAGAVGVRGEYQRGRVGLAQPQGERGAAARAAAAAVAAGGNGQGGSAVFFPGQQSQHEDGGIDAFSLLPGDDEEDDEPAPAAARTGPRFLAVARVFAGTLASADAPGAAPISPDATVTLFGPRYSGPKTRKSHDDGSDDDDEEEEEEAAAAATAAADALGVSSGTALAALGSGGDDGNTATLPQSRLNFYTLMGGENQPVSRAYAGNVIGITGIDDVVFKSFTMSSLASAPPLRPLVYQALPIVRVVVETEDLTKAKALEAALRVLAVIDPNVHVGLTEQGELFVAASGELHLERCMRDLTDTLLPGVALRVHPPSVAFRETIVDADAMTAAATAAAAAAAAAPAAGDKDKEKDKEKEKEKGKKGGKSGSGGGLLRVTTPNGCVTVRMRLAPLPETVTRLLDTSAPHLRSARSKIDASRAGLRRLLGSVLARANGLEEDEDDDAATTALSSGAVLSRAEREVFASLRKAFQAWGVDQNGGTPPVPAPASDDTAAPVVDSLAAAAAEGPVTVADFIALDAAPSVRKLMESGDICDYICAFGPKKWGPNLLVNKVPGLALATSAAAAAAAGAGAVVPGKWARGLAWLRAAAAHGVVVVEDEDAASVPATLVPVPAIGANEEKKQADMTVTRSQLDALEAIARFTRTAEHGLMQGFQLATAAGPICGEPMTGVCVSIEQCETIDWITDEWGPDPSGPMQGQVLTAIKDAIHVAFTARPRRIVEAVFAVTMQCTEEHLGRLFSVLSRRRGRVVDDTTVVEGTGFFQIKALLPVQSSFGFATDVREQTGGVTNPLLVFSHWEVIPDDPYYVPITEDDIEEFGVGGDLSRNVAKDIVTEVRKRKGLWVDEKVVAAPEKQRTLARKK